MKIPESIENQVREIVRQCVEKASKHFGKQYIVPNVLFNVRGRMGGCARGDYLVNFNPILLMENQEEYFKQVIPHEVAHCIDAANGRDIQYQAGYRLKRSIHGPSWKRIMRLFGCEPTRCHQMNTTNAAVRIKTKYEYYCRGCNRTYFMGPVRHKKQQHHASLTGCSFYTCNKCGRERGTLAFVANRGKVSLRDFREEQQPAQTQNNFTGSNYELARRIFYYGGAKDRQAFIAQAVAEGMKPTTASTYYASLKRA